MRLLIASVSELGIVKTQDWIAQECNYNNPALKHSSYIGDRWRGESSMTAETIYREAWKCILDVKRSAIEGNPSTSASAIFIATKFLPLRCSKLQENCLDN